MRIKHFILFIAILTGSPAIKSYSQNQTTSVKTLDAGWYTIAKNTGSRASAKFSVRETKSGYHSATHFYAQHHFGMNASNQINVLANSFYGGGGAIRYIRIVEGSTYAGALLQIYIDAGSTTGCYAEITNNIQSSGWEVVDWEPAAMILPNGETGSVITQVDLDKNNGLIISHDLHVGNNLEVKGKLKMSGQPLPRWDKSISAYAFESAHFYGKTSSDWIYVGEPTNTVNIRGNVAIGSKFATGYKLSVEGKAIAEEVVVNLKTAWPDYVFEEDYPLMPLNELEDFLEKYKHLPEIPTAEEVREKGQSLGEMNVLLLKKVEELTLYMIELKKENEKLKDENEKQDMEIEKLKQIIK